jgi:hypothetical protein
VRGCECHAPTAGYARPPAWLHQVAQLITRRFKHFQFNIPFRAALGTTRLLCTYECVGAVASLASAGLQLFDSTVWICCFARVALQDAAGLFLQWPGAHVLNSSCVHAMLLRCLLLCRSTASARLTSSRRASQARRWRCGSAAAAHQSGCCHTSRPSSRPHHHQGTVTTSSTRPATA